MSSLPEPYFTPEEYLDLERHAVEKSGYLSGHILAMAGASPEHITLTANLTSELHSQLRGSPCRVYPSDLRVRVPTKDFYTYPDIAIVCGGLIFDERDPSTVTNPNAIFEVLSPSTELYDRGDKFAYYRQIPSLTDYILVAQNRYRIEHFFRQSTGEWLFRVAEGLEESLEIPSLGVSLRLSAIYEYIDLLDDNL
jgi:Uma2 family endonuclease